MSTIGSQIPDLGYRISDVESRIPDIGFRIADSQEQMISDLRKQISDIQISDIGGYQVPNIRCQVPQLQYQRSTIGSHISDIGYRITDIIYRITDIRWPQLSDLRYQISDIRYSDIRYQTLKLQISDIGYWAADIRYRISDFTTSNVNYLSDIGNRMSALTYRIYQVTEIKWLRISNLRTQISDIQKATIGYRTSDFRFKVAQFE